MGTESSKKFHIGIKRFKRWIHSDKFTEFIAKFIAIFVIGLMVFSAFIAMIK